jgi:hypothetical protein
MEIDLALLADAATIDGGGKLNIIGIFDRLGTNAFPTRHPRMSLVLRFAAGIHEAGTHAVIIVLKDPRGKELMKIDGEMKLAAGPGDVAGGIRVPHILNLDGLVFPVAGRYAFDVIVDGEHAVSIPLTVNGPSTAAKA